MLSSNTKCKLIVNKGNIYQIKKADKLNKRKQMLISMCEAILYTDNDDLLHLSLELLQSSDSFIGLENPYEVPCLQKSDTSPNETISISDYRSCDLTQTKEDSTQLHVVRLFCGLFSNVRGKTLHLYLKNSDDANAWHSVLTRAIKCCGKWSTYERQERRLSETTSLSGATTISDDLSLCSTNPSSSVNVSAELVDFDMINMMDNDIYESTCPKDSYRATIIETEHSKSLALSGEYFLRINQENVELLDQTSLDIVLRWEIKFIRKFGVSKDTLKIEAGNSCQCGPGCFTFTVVHVDDFLKDLMAAKKDLQTKQLLKKPFVKPPEHIATTIKSSPITCNSLAATKSHSGPASLDPIPELSAYAVTNVDCPMIRNRFPFSSLRLPNSSKKEGLISPPSSEPHIYAEHAESKGSSYGFGLPRVLPPLPPPPVPIAALRKRHSAAPVRNNNKQPVKNIVEPLFSHFLATSRLALPQLPQVELPGHTSVVLPIIPISENSSESVEQKRDKISKLKCVHWNKGSA